MADSVDTETRVSFHGPYYLVPFIINLRTGEMVSE